MISKTSLNPKYNKSILFIFITILLLFSFNQISIPFGKAQTVNDISVDTAYGMIKNVTQYPDLIILDVRTEEEYNSSHLFNSTLISLNELESRISELEAFKNTEIIVYCRTGVRSQQASEILVNNGFTKVYNMLGGITVWIDTGYEYWSSENGNGTENIISFSLTIFIMCLLGIITILTIYVKKRQLE